MRLHKRAATRLQIKVISAAVASCFAADLALANPTGPAVANGQVTFHQQGNLLQITNSPNAIINWQSFSIGANEITRFLQQSASSAVLNRVITQNPSSILGALQSNGRVFLINPNGILFGPGSQIDVAGLVASTLNLSDADFLGGRLRFTEVPGAGSVINQGAINAASGGQVYLVGPAVKNEGLITSPKGDVILAAGNSVELVNPSTPDLRVEITAPDNEAVNLGQITADAGRVGIYAGLINQSGSIRANSAQLTEDGRIVLRATKGVNLEAGSMTAASGVQGGNVTVETETGTIRVAGKLDASGSEAGGSINLAVTGESGAIDLAGGLNAGNAAINVSGTGHTVTLNGDMVTAGAPIEIIDSVILGAPASITLDTTNGGAVTGGANITITGTVDDDVAGSSGLTLNAGTAGVNALDGAVGSTTPIASLTTNGNATEINGGSVTTTGSQIYNAPVTLDGPTTLNATGPAGSIAINRSLSGGANNLTINSGNNVVIAGNVFSGPQTVNAVGGLMVQSSASGSAELSATGGQTINARFVEVTAQENNFAGISNFTSGDQIINVSGGGSSPGIDIQSLPSGGIASIGNNAEGATQTITVIDADHINVNGAGPNFTNVSAIIHAIPGTQTISITGSGANAINIGSSGALGGSIINARSQNITAGENGESGSITIVGADVDTRFAAILTNAGFAGSQVVSTSGALAIMGGNAPNQPNASAIRHNAFGPQTVTAASIALEGGSSGTGNGVDLRSVSGSQTVTVTGGGTLSLQGGGGTDNFARIRADAGNQQINVAGGAITITGGDGPDVPFPENTANNFARIENRTAGGIQTVVADTITLTGGAAGENNFAGLQGANQFITTNSDITLQGGAAGGSGARLGGASDVTATNAVLNVGGKLTLTSGAGAGGTIGSNQDGGLTTDIVVNASGDIILNSGPSAVARIGSPFANVAGGNISLTSTGGDIVLNGGASIRTLGAIALSTPGALMLTGGTSDSGSPTLVQSSSGQTITAGNILLTGGSSGNSNSVEIAQTGPGSTQTIAVTNGGTLALQGGSGGSDNFARIRNQGVHQQFDFFAGGALTLTGGSGISNDFAQITANSGSQTITGTPAVILTGGTGGLPDLGNRAQIRAQFGAQTINAAGMTITGGASGVSNGANLQGLAQNIHVAGNLTLTGGGSESGASQGGSARLGGPGGAALAPTNLTLDVGGNVTLQGGDVATALIGSSTLGGTAENNIMMTVLGDVTLNPGSGNGARIGASAGSPIGGNISIFAGGNIALNSANGIGTAIRTEGDVILNATGPIPMGRITQGANSIIRANHLTTATTSGTSLGGNNQVAVFNATNTFDGDIVFNNSSPLLTITGVQFGAGLPPPSPPPGALTLTQNGDLNLTGFIFSGPQFISATGDISVVPSSPAVISALGPQVINAGGGLKVESSALGAAQIIADGGQTIDANYIEVTAQGGHSTFITNFGSGDQVLTTHGANAAGDGIAVRNKNSDFGFALIDQQAGVGFQQSITVNNADYMRVIGEVGTAQVSGGFSGATQTISLTGPGKNALKIGAVNAAGNSFVVGGSQTITAGLPAEQGSIMLQGGAMSGAATVIQNLDGPQTIAVSGPIGLTGGTGVGPSFTSLSNFTSGNQNISAHSLTLQGGNSGTGNSVTVFSSGSQEVNIGAGGINLAGGADGFNNFAFIDAIGGPQEIKAGAGGLTLKGGGGSQNWALILHDFNASGNQTVTVDGGNLAMIAGNSGATNYARILNLNPDGNQMVTVNGGNIALSGGNGGTNNFADIFQPGGSGDQSVAITGGGTLLMQGGLLGADNFARVRNNGLNQDIYVPGGAIIVSGGSNASPDTGGNFARIENRGSGTQTVNAGTIAMTGGPAGDSNFAGIQAAHQRITTAGDVTLVGGGGTVSGARIGAVGATTPTDLILNVGGKLTLTGGDVSDASLGANREGGQQTDIVVTAAGDITLNPGADPGANARIGSPEVAVAGGKISLTSTGGDVVLNGGTWILTRGEIAINTPGTLSLTAGSDPNRWVQIRSGSGQNITAGNIALTGGAGGTGNFADIRQTGPFDQVINVTGGGTLFLQGGADGLDNFARIRNDGPNQTVNVPGGAIVITGGSGPDDLSDPTDTVNNFARIENRGAGTQTVNAGTIAMTAGPMGQGNFAGIQSAHQQIATTGNVTLMGGGGSSGARIGAIGTLSDTDVTLNVGGNLLLSGGSSSGAAIGSDPAGGTRTDIVVSAVGDITLNPGGTGARIGSPPENPGRGDILVSSSGGSIALNSAGGIRTVIRTLDDVFLTADTITQGDDSRIQARQLTTTTRAGTNLGGDNLVAVFNATNGASGGVLLHNTSPSLTVTGVSTIPGPFTLTQDGDLAVTGDIWSGPQTINVSGDMIVGSDSNSVILYAAGPRTGKSVGEPHASWKALGVGLLDRLAGHSPVNISAKSLSVQGGSGFGSFAAITGGPINITTTGDKYNGDFSLAGGSGFGAFGWVLSSQDVNLNIGGKLRLDSGNGFLSFARIQTVRPTSKIDIYFPNLSSGGYFVNGRKGVVRDGLSGFYTGPHAAKSGKGLLTDYGL